MKTSIQLLLCSFLLLIISCNNNNSKNEAEIIDELIGILGSPIALLIAYHIIKVLFGLAKVSIIDTIYQKDDSEVMERVFNDLSKNDKFFIDSSKIIANKQTLDPEITKQIAKLPIVQKAINDAIKWKRQKDKPNVTPVTPETTERQFRTFLIKNWDDNAIKSKIIDKIKSNN